MFRVVGRSDSANERDEADGGVSAKDFRMRIAGIIWSAVVVEELALEGGLGGFVGHGILRAVAGYLWRGPKCFGQGGPTYRSSP